MSLSVNSINQLIFVIVKCGVLFEVRSEFLNIFCTRFGFEGLIKQNGIKTYGGMEVQLLVFLTSALGCGEWLACTGTGSRVGVVKNPASYSGGPWFNSRPGDRLS
jgi:hypothetical protein